MPYAVDGSAKCEASIRDTFSDQVERRSDARTYAVFRVAKLLIDGEEMLCRIKNISARGIMAETLSPPEVQQPISVELRDGERLEGQVAWTSKRAFGVTFADRIDIARVLTKDVSEEGRSARPARVKAHCSVNVRIGAVYKYAEIEDISQNGCRLKFGEVVPQGQEMVLRVEGLPAIKGVVRWCRDGETGIAFNEAISYNDLEHWLWMRRSGQQAAAQPPAQQLG
jgi:hypothetical protein